MPFDRELRARSARRSSSTTSSSGRSAPRTSSVGENFRFGHKAQGDTALLAADERFETRVVPLAGGRRRGRQLEPHPRPDPRRRGRVRRAAAGRAVHRRRARSRTATSAAARWATRPRTSCPPEGYAIPGHGVYAARATTATGAAHVAAVNVGVRPMFVTGRGELIEAYLVDFDGDLYGTRAAHRVPQAPARREALRRRRRARRADGPRRRRARAIAGA